MRKTKQENDVTKQEAIEYFGSIAELARAIGQTRRSIELWKSVVPKCRRQRVRDAMKIRAEQLEQEARTLRAKSQEVN